ncbi:hypothetical protein [Paenibacillus sp. RC67]|uniref:hypothetical protein n=1 Tax=Paenibacillus sp. RC67 TaxID=3039392 RepID=UPI0024ACF01A|nr:hypothetical protein [Paenibacillus sp. RC67]
MILGVHWIGCGFLMPYVNDQPDLTRFSSVIAADCSASWPLALFFGTKLAPDTPVGLFGSFNAVYRR